MAAGGGRRQHGAMDLRRLLNPVDRVPRDGRVVERYRTLGLHLTWRPPTRRWLWIRPRPAAAEVIDLSVSGALLLAPTNPEVRTGSVVELSCDGARGRVQVRHVHQSLDPEQHYYGVLFLQLQPELRQRLFDLVAKERGDLGHLESLWRSAN